MTISRNKKSSPSLKVRVWMLEEGVSGREIATEYGCTRGAVSLFIQGKRTSKGLAKQMIKLGCPREYFKNGRVAA